VDSVVALTTASNEGQYVNLNMWPGSDLIIVFGMGLDLGAFLSVYSGVMAGDIVSVSIGGKPKSGLLGGLTSSLGLLGEAQGLSASHNRFEADASPTRADLYTRYVTENYCYNNSGTNAPKWRPSFSQPCSV
jgi:hypothetical protein